MNSHDKIGFQSGSGTVNYLNRILSRQPPVWKVYGNADKGLVSAIKSACPSTEIIVRNIGRGLDYGWNDDYIACAHAVADAHIAALSQYLQWQPWAETINEPPTYDKMLTLQQNIDRAKRGNEWGVIVALKMKAAGFKVIAYNFSMGTPALVRYGDPLNLMPYYADGVAAADALGLHEYDRPYMLNNVGSLLFRYREQYQLLPIKKPIWLTEYGIDNGDGCGYRCYMSLQEYMRQLALCNVELNKDPYLLGAAVFNLATDSAQWTNFNLMEDSDYENLSNYYMGGVVSIDPTQPPTGGVNMTTAQERFESVWQQLGVPFNPEAALTRYARDLKLGAPLPGQAGNEYRWTNAQGQKIVRQNFLKAFCECLDGDWGNVKAYDYYTGDAYTPESTPGPTQPPGTNYLKRLTQADCPLGMILQPTTLAKGSKAYVLVGIVNVKSGDAAGTETKVQVLNEQGSPVAGTHTVHAFDATNKRWEAQPSPEGKFDLGPGSYFYPGKPPADQFYVSTATLTTANGSGSWPQAAGDVLWSGMADNTHLEATYIFQLQLL